mmetsp:Transcript_2624/g.6165  ORF Transcript_2624/g.6165 Transcript_2624/m.6165 type:complete len:362 (-) Transcript_2624:88-1173(-)
MSAIDMDVDGGIPFGRSGDMADDSGVQSTTEDSAISKFSSVTLGYYDDPFVRHVVRFPVKRAPIINRGYYARVSAMRASLLSFLESCPGPCQVVNLGAGLDTTFFWLQSKHDNLVKKGLTYFEVDFQDSLTKKTGLILKKPALMTVFGPTKDAVPTVVVDGSTLVRTETYRMVASDLREVQSLESNVLAAGFSKDVPTVFLCECSLVYIRPEASDAVIQWAARATADGVASGMVVYEQTNPNDRFGQVMVQNLRERGCPLLGVHAYPTVEAQKQRFCDLGWGQASICNMNTYFDKFLDREEYKRVCRLELFDELEEWWLIQGHYFILMASKATAENSWMSNVATIWDNPPEHPEVRMPCTF